jgi:preprotein translocase subunit SecD
MNKKFKIETISKYILLVVLLICFMLSSKSQTNIYKCDGIYRTSKSGQKLSLASDSSKIFLVDPNPIVCFSEFKLAEFGISHYDRKPILSIELNDNATMKFDSATAKNIGKPLLIIFENSIVSAPNVIQQIEDGKIQVTGLEEKLIKQIVAKVQQ